MDGLAPESNQLEQGEAAHVGRFHVPGLQVDDDVDGEVEREKGETHTSRHTRTQAITYQHRFLPLQGPFVQCTVCDVCGRKGELGSDTSCHLLYPRTDRTKMAV